MVKNTISRYCPFKGTAAWDCFFQIKPSYRMLKWDFDFLIINLGLDGFHLDKQEV